jgi:hypothetical protein
VGGVRCRNGQIVADREALSHWLDAGGMNTNFTAMAALGFDITGFHHCWWTCHDANSFHSLDAIHIEWLSDSSSRGLDPSFVAQAIAFLCRFVCMCII